jgi:hypothetical protein
MQLEHSAAPFLDAREDDGVLERPIEPSRKFLPRIAHTHSDLCNNHPYIPLADQCTYYTVQLSASYVLIDLNQSYTPTPDEVPAWSHFEGIETTLGRSSISPTRTIPTVVGQSVSRSRWDNGKNTQTANCFKMAPNNVRQLYAAALLQRIKTDLGDNLYGNPHSDSVPSLHTSECIESVRLQALRFFKADPEDFDIVFTANATAAIKLLLECLKDYTKSECKGLWYGYHQDAHTSLVGARELADAHKCFGHDCEVDEWVEYGRLSETNDAALHLLAYPGQSNMTGRRLPSHW